MEDDDYKRRPDYLALRVDVLEDLVKQIVLLLPAQALELLVDHIGSENREAARLERQSDTDPARDRATAIYELYDPLRADIDQLLQDYDDGARGPVIQGVDRIA